jgi:hypothetical protein
MHADTPQTPTVRGSNTLKLGPGFAVLARDIAANLRERAALAGPGSGINALRILLDEAEWLARRFQAWEADPPSAAERLQLVQRLSKLGKVVGL